MPSPLSLPRIRVDLPDGSPCRLSPSSTLDFRDILGQARLLPKLLAEDLVFDGADDGLYLKDGRLQDLPPFPMRRRPRLFTLDSHHTRLPFPLRQATFGTDDSRKDKGDACPLLTAPTVPRMKRMMKEQLYVQKWVDTLALDNPPKHIPWTCEKPVVIRKWVAEGSIFPADVIKSGRSFTEQHGVIQGHSRVTDRDKLLALVDQAPAPHSRDPESGPIHAPTESHASTPHVCINPADDDLGMLRGKPEASRTPHCVVRTSQASSPSTLLPSGSSIETTSSAPLAARRGKSLSGLNLQGCDIERLEYPDIPTAFRGSPIVWSPRFGTFPVPFFTDHESMVLDLKSKCAALGVGVSAYIQDPLSPQTELTRTSLSIDEWAFARGLATFDNSFFGSFDNQDPKEITDDAGTFLPDASSTPVKDPSFTASPKFVSRCHLAPAMRPPGNCSGGPPGIPLPPRPVLINQSTPPHVRGILKKVKNVRFEDTSLKESENHAASVVSLPPPEQPSPLHATVSFARPHTPMPITVEPTDGLAPVKEAPVKNIQKKSAPKSRLPPKRAKVNAKLELKSLNVTNTPEPSKPILATTLVKRPCRIEHAKKNNDPATVPRAQTKQKSLLLTEIDVRRGIEGTTKNRLSTPLRNIFRLR